MSRPKRIITDRDRSFRKTRRVIDGIDERDPASSGANSGLKVFAPVRLRVRVYAEGNRATVLSWICSQSDLGGRSSDQGRPREAAVLSSLVHAALKTPDVVDCLPVGAKVHRRPPAAESPASASMATDAEAGQIRYGPSSTIVAMADAVPR